MIAEQALAKELIEHPLIVTTSVATGEYLATTEIKSKGYQCAHLGKSPGKVQECMLIKTTIIMLYCTLSISLETCIITSPDHKSDKSDHLWIVIHDLDSEPEKVVHVMSNWGE